MNGKSSSSISRREFARRAAIVSAVSFVPPPSLSIHSEVAGPSPQQSSGTPATSAESQGEAGARYQMILALYGSRFSETQRTDLERLCALAQVSVDHLRAYLIENGDSPALYLKPLIEREKKPESVGVSRAVTPRATKP